MPKREKFYITTAIPYANDLRNLASRKIQRH